MAHVERVETQRIDRPRRPQPQGIDVPAAPPHDRDIIGDRLDGLGRMPDRAFGPRRRRRRFDAAPEVDVIDRFWPRKLPWIAEG